MFSFFSCKDNPTNENSNSVTEETKQHLPPDERYGSMFKEIQLARVFPDGKTFVDTSPKFPTDVILAKYEEQKNLPDFDLKTFVLENFDLPKQYASGFESDTSKTAAEHINSLWTVLTREPDESGMGTLIPLPHPYIVPGGRFGEIYYWDSYFTILGLQAAGKADMIENMVNNFSYLIDTVGFIPNGNRTYFLGRSQPPFYAAIVGVLAEMKGDEIYKTYLPQLEKEYNFWMDGVEQLDQNKETAYRRVVRLNNGSILNRYWDNFESPRPESYKEDVETAKETKRPAKTVYRHLRAGAESGWDYSSRWFADKQNISTIHTTDIIPVDLNALLYNLEVTLFKAQSVAGNQEAAATYQQKAAQRQQALINFCWNEEKGLFMDYDFKANVLTNVPSLATMYPLYFNMATPEQAEKVAQVIEKDFLQAGGVPATLNRTGQQWDAPNGWAPLQWMTIKGLRNYEHNTLANTIKERWVALNVKVYKNTGKMVEKYNVMDEELEAGGGEYPLQDGFGWTNGILLKLLSE